jgi:hypothetical protein
MPDDLEIPMSNVHQSGCACCGTAADGTNPGAVAESAVRVRFAAGAEQLGISGDDLTDLMVVFDGGDCPATQTRMAHLVEARIDAAQERSVALTEQAAAMQVAHGGARPEMPKPVVDLTDEIVTTLAGVSRLQAAAARLAEPPTPGACDEDCACVTAASAQITPRILATRMALSAAALPGGNRPDLVCTLDGGLDAMRGRIGEWKAVIAQATGREPADGGVTLVYDHDPAVTVELGRLAAAEFACCSFFTFTLTVAPDGMRFTISAPDEARDAVTAVFGTATPAPVGGTR